MRLLGLVLTSVVLASCSGQVATGSTPVRASHTATPAMLASPGGTGCGSTAILQGGIPAWLDSAGSHNNPTGVPYVIGHPALVAGFLFGDPLRAGHPENRANKILWVVRTPREGSQLVIDGHPLGTTTPRVHQGQPADSSPGEIYPSIVDVPTAGCWQFDLQWATSRAQVELMYVAP
jgi:hypothetical protein